jgi:hypothetical protein
MPRTYTGITDTLFALNLFPDQMETLVPVPGEKEA